MDRARWLRHAHGALAVGWAVMIPVSVFTGLRNSVPFLVALSVYALAVSHAAAYSGSRAETKEED